MIKSVIAGALLTLPVLAHAYTTWEDPIKFDPAPEIAWLSTYTFTHDLTRDGFNPGVDSVSGYTLTIGFRNDDGPLDVIAIDQPGSLGDSAALFFNWSYASLTTGSSYKGIASLNNNGLLNVSVTNLLGAFYLDSSDLKATGTKDANTHAVPEPTSVALLAAGLLGIAVMRRRTNKAS